VGSIPLNVQAKLERNEDLGVIIRATWARYAKVLKGVWMERDWNFPSTKTMRHKEISLFM
jgi:hypothetical protein